MFKTVLLGGLALSLLCYLLAQNGNFGKALPTENPEEFRDPDDNSIETTTESGFRIILSRRHNRTMKQSGNNNSNENYNDIYNENEDYSNPGDSQNLSFPSAFIKYEYISTPQSDYGDDHYLPPKKNISFSTTTTTAPTFVTRFLYEFTTTRQPESTSSESGNKQFREDHLTESTLDSQGLFPTERNSEVLNAQGWESVTEVSTVDAKTTDNDISYLPPVSYLPIPPPPSNQPVPLPSYLPLPPPRIPRKPNYNSFKEPQLKAESPINRSISPPKY